jgi:hypothetical protein
MIASERRNLKDRIEQFDGSTLNIILNNATYLPDL